MPRTLGVSWGRTLFDISQHLRNGWATGVNVVQINGGVSLNRRPGTAAATAVGIAQKGGGSATLLPSPAILERLATKQAIESDRVVAGVLELARSADAYLFSAGAADHNSVHVESGYLSRRRRRRARAEGRRRRRRRAATSTPTATSSTPRSTPARSGSRSTSSAPRRSRSPSSPGPAKHAVADAVVRSGLCIVLVTDEATALHLLDG